MEPSCTWSVPSPREPKKPVTSVAGSVATVLMRARSEYSSASFAPGAVVPIPTFPVPRLKKACWLVRPGKRASALEVAVEPIKTSSVIFVGAMLPFALCQLVGSWPGSSQERVPLPLFVST